MSVSLWQFNMHTVKRQRLVLDTPPPGCDHDAPTWFHGNRTKLDVNRLEVGSVHNEVPSDHDSGIAAGHTIQYKILGISDIDEV